MGLSDVYRFARVRHSLLMRKRLVLMALVAGSLYPLLSQGKAPILQSDLYILFLTQHAADALRRASGGAGADTAAVASRLHLSAAEVGILDHVASAFVGQDRRLADEARNYHRAALSSSGAPAPLVVHSFTQRREALAVAAVSDIQRQISPQAFQSLRSYLNTEFAKSITRMR